MKPECHNSVEVPAFLAGELGQREAAEFESHLKVCPACQENLEKTRGVLARLRELGPVEIESDLTGAVLARIGQKRPAARYWLRNVAAAAAVIIFAGTAVMMRPSASSGRDAVLVRAHEWLCKHQEADGSWDAVKWGGLNQFKVALSALPTLALLSAEELDAEHVASVQRSVEWLQRQQSDTGMFGPVFQGAPYNQSIATLALLRVYQRQPQWVSKPALDQALKTMLSRQTADGSWGYLRSPFGDRSITEWHVEALRLASAAGWENVRESLARAERWLDANPALSAKEPIDSPSELIAQAGSPGALATQQGTSTLNLDFQRAYLVTTHSKRAKVADQTVEGIRKFLMHCQERQGTENGSWAPNDRWGRAGGRLYSTAMASLSLSS